jgi:hypothetical protein
MPTQLNLTGPLWKGYGLAFHRYESAVSCDDEGKREGTTSAANLATVRPTSGNNPYYEDRAQALAHLEEWKILHLRGSLVLALIRSSPRGSAMDSVSRFVMDRGKISGPFNDLELESMAVRGVCSPYSKVSIDKKSWADLSQYLSDRQARLNAPEPLRPPPLSADSVSPLQGFPTTLSSKVLRPFSLLPLLLLHYLTAGLYTFFSVTAILGGLPRVRSDDPSTGKAIGLCFLPLFNMYWICLIYPRLGSRINGTCATYGLQPAVPLALTYVVSACMVVPLAMATIGCLVLSVLYLSFPNEQHTEAWLVFFVFPHAFTLLNYLVVWPWFAGAVQLGINRVFELQVAVLLSQHQSTFSNGVR